MHAKQECSGHSTKTTPPLDPWAPELLPPLELALVVEDCLFAFVNAQSPHSRDMLWPLLVESVEALLTDFRRRFTSDGPEAAVDRSRLVDQ
ncbi:MAG: hypothetical protein HQL76_01020 [Magnetococcales bacterium]|nr:hypothetical protein [Magnetococcales bacterium]